MRTLEPHDRNRPRFPGALWRAGFAHGGAGKAAISCLSMASFVALLGVERRKSWIVA